MAGSPRNSVVCVLGMHRSGTSCLVGSLQNCGLNLGKHHTWNRYNRQGNRENQDIVDLNDAVLAHSGGSWDRPPSQITFTTQHLDQAKAIINAFPDQAQWGFKDPRALLTLPMWREALAGQFARIGIFRHPFPVAASLGYRAGANVMPETMGLDLWYHYNQRLLAEYRRAPFPILCFDWPEEEFHAKLASCLPELGLGEAPTGERFYNRELLNYGAQDLTIVARKYRSLYKKLRAVAL